MIIDVVTLPDANLHQELLDVLEVKGQSAAWGSPTDLNAVAYRAVTTRKAPRLEAWPETLTLGGTLPVLPLWLSIELCVPLTLEESYQTTCQSLRIPA